MDGIRSEWAALRITSYKYKRARWHRFLMVRDAACWQGEEARNPYRPLEFTRTSVGCTEHSNASDGRMIHPGRPKHIIRKINLLCVFLASFSSICGSEAAITESSIRKVSLFFPSLASFDSFGRFVRRRWLSIPSPKQSTSHASTKYLWGRLSRGVIKVRSLHSSAFDRLFRLPFLQMASFCHVRCPRFSILESLYSVSLLHTRRHDRSELLIEIVVGHACTMRRHRRLCSSLCAHTVVCEQDFLRGESGTRPRVEDSHLEGMIRGWIRR
jgi:hypothetical protein